MNMVNIIEVAAKVIIVAGSEKSNALAFWGNDDVLNAAKL